MANELALVEASDLSLVNDNILNDKQLKLILKRTPKQYVKERPAKGGGTWQYVSGGYVKKVLNIMFGWDWDFEILDEKILIEAKEIVVKGRLTCRSNGKVIVKTQYGNKDIIFRKDGNNVPLSVGNDLKAAATDCLKKCASELGIAADIYNKQDFIEVHVNIEKKENSLDLLKELFAAKHMQLSKEDIEAIQRIIETKEENSYKKTIKKLSEL